MWLQKHRVEYFLSCYDLMNVLPINCFLSPTFQEIQSLTNNPLDTHQESNFFQSPLEQLHIADHDFYTVLIPPFAKASLVVL